jgi:hypothetical protein
MSEPQECPMNERDDRALDRLSFELPADLKALEARFAALVPRDDRLNRERLMFLAGRASVEGPIAIASRMPRKWLVRNAWPAAFACMSAVAAMLLVSLINRPIVYRPHGTQIAAAERPVPVLRPSIERILHSDGDVLSVGDARHRDIETRVSGESHLVAFDAANSPLNEQEPTALRPNAWRQIIDASEGMRPNSNDSSDMRALKGARS